MSQSVPVVKVYTSISNKDLGANPWKGVLLKPLEANCTSKEEPILYRNEEKTDGEAEDLIGKENPPPENYTEGDKYEWLWQIQVSRQYY